MPPDALLQQISFPEPSVEAIIAFAMTSLVYLVASLLALFFAPRDAKLIAVGIITAVASIGYSGLVGGGAVVVAPTLMKIGVLLVLGGIVTRILDKPQAAVVEEGSHD